MNIKNRIKKIESGLMKTSDAGRIIWNFTKTTTEQLLKLESLIESNNLTEAESYTAWLLGNGFLSRRVVGKEFV